MRISGWEWHICPSSSNTSWTLFNISLNSQTASGSGLRNCASSWATSTMTKWSSTSATTGSKFRRSSASVEAVLSFKIWICFWISRGLRSLRCICCVSLYWSHSTSPISSPLSTISSHSTSTQSGIWWATSLDDSFSAILLELCNYIVLLLFIHFSLHSHPRAGH